jgi:hypothetical protein
MNICIYAYGAGANDAPFWQEGSFFCCHPTFSWIFHVFFIIFTNSSCARTNSSCTFGLACDAAAHCVAASSSWASRLARTLLYVGPPGWAARLARLAVNREPDGRATPRQGIGGSRREQECQGNYPRGHSGASASSPMPPTGIASVNKSK